MNRSAADIGVILAGVALALAMNRTGAGDVKLFDRMGLIAKAK